MKLVTFRKGDEAPRPGLLQGDAVVDMAEAGFADALACIRAGAEAIRAGAEGARGATLGRRAVRLLAPLLRPRRIFCVGLNYRDHAVESKMEIPKVPAIFMKLASAVIGPGEAVRIPKMTRQPDYEAELAFVIGKGGKHIAGEEWKDHVFGVTILNDVSARDVQLATSQWMLGKSFDTFCPIGPAIVTLDEVGDPHALDIRLSIGGEVLQHSNTRELIFKAPDLIAYISSVTALEPGDMISTGTPAGVGMGRSPQRWLEPGETMVAEIEGIGTLENPVAAGD